MKMKNQRLQKTTRALGAVAALWAFALTAGPAAAKGSVAMEATVSPAEVYPLDLVTYKLEIVRTEGASEVYPVLPHFGEFKVPSLRNVALTAPYMHNGSLATLADVVRHYSELSVDRLHADGEKLLLKPLRLSGRESADLVAFLKNAK